MKLDEHFMIFKTEKYRERSAIKRFLLKRFLKKINRLFVSCQPHRVLEIGCGEGFVLGFLSTLHPEVKYLGIDIDSQQLKLLKEHFPTIITSQEDIINTDPAGRNFDLVLAIEVLEHINDYQKALNNISQFSNKYILISVPWEPAFRLSNLLRGKNIKRWGNDIEHVNNWSKKKITKIVSDYFNIIRAEISFPWTVILAQKK